MTTIIILLIYSVLVTICFNLLSSCKEFDSFINITFVRIIGGPLTWIMLLLDLISSKIKKRG